MRKLLFVLSFLAMALVFGTARAEERGEAAYRIGCSTQIQVNPCSRVCWELWTDTQKREIEKRCAAQQTPNAR